MSRASILVPAVGPERRRLALLHSNGMCASVYVPLAERLAQAGTTCTLLDLPGFGAARPAAVPGWPSTLAAVQEQVAQALGPGGVLVGHSLGGLVALQLAPQLPLTGLVLMEPAIFPWRWLARLGASLYVRRVFPGDDRVPRFTNRGPWFWRLHDPASFPDEVFAELAQAHAQTDRATVAALHAGLPACYPLPFDQVRVPTLLVRGSSSGAVMRWGQRDLARRLPQSTSVTLERAGHYMIHEQDDALAAAITSWLSVA